MFPKNKFRGSDRVIIVGSGPSAANFVAPRGVPIIAVNGAIDWLNRASYFFTLDPSPDNMRRVGRGRRRRGAGPHISAFAKMRMKLPAAIVHMVL